MNISRELKVGLIAILALAALYWGVNFLKGSNLFDDKRYFYAIYQRIDGLSPSRPVNINGFQVGQVSDIYFHPDNSGRLVVKLSMTNDFSIPENTKARIYSSDLLGEKAVELVLGKSTKLAQPGDTLTSDISLSLTEEVNQQVAPLKEKAEKLLGSIDTVMVLASGFLNKETQKNFSETFESIRRSFTTLEHSVNVFDTTLTRSQGGLITSIDNLAKISTSLEQNRDELDHIFKNLDSVTDSLSKVRFQETFRALNSALVATQSVMEKVNEGEGSMGKLVNDPALYQNLTDATEQMNLLLLDIKYNPNRYINLSIFGNDKQYSEKEILEKEAQNKRNREKIKQEAEDN